MVTATVAPSDAVVTWTSSRPDVATVAGSGTSARIVAVAAGTTSITVQATARGRSGSGTVAVQVVPIVRSVRIDSVDATVVLGRTRQLRARVTADAGADTAVRWTSATPTVATVDAAGLVTAVGVGAARIDVASAVSSTVTSSTSLTVVAPQVRGVALSPGTDTIPVSATRRFVATVDADSELGTGVAWSSSATAVATVAADGLVTAVAPGTAIISARSVADTSKRAQATLVVRAPSVRGLTLTAVPILRERDAHNAVVSVDAETGADLRLAWTSSDNTVAVVAANGVLTALRAGATTLTVSSVAFPAVRQSRTVTVVPWPPFLTWTRQVQGVVGTLRADGLPTSMVSRSATQAMMTLQSDFWSTLGDNTTYVMDGNTWVPIAGTDFSTPAIGGLTNHNNGEVIGWGQAANFTVDLYRWNGAWNVVPRPSVGTFATFPAPQSLPGGRIATKGRDGSFDQILLWNGVSWSELRRWGRAGMYTRGNVWMTTPTHGILHQDVQGGYLIAEYTAPSTMRLIPEPSFNLLQFPVYRGTRPDSVFATGRGSSRLHRWNGTSWSVLDAPWPSTDLIATFEQCNGTLIVLTLPGRVYRFENGQFHQLGTDSDVLTEDRGFEQQLSCAPDGTIRVAAANGAISRWTGSTWTIESFTPRYTSVSAASASLAWAGSTIGRIYHWNGSSWQESYRPSPVGSSGSITSIVSWADGRVVALRGTGAIVRRSGGVWTEESGGELVGVNAVWGPSADLVFAVRTDGRIIRSVNGGAWQPVSPAGTALVAIEGLGTNHAIAIGRSLRTLRWDGNTWTEVLADVSGVLNANRLHVSGVNDAWVAVSATVGNTRAPLPRMRRFNGTTWSETDVAAIGGDDAATGITTLALFGTGASNVYALRGAGRGPRTLYRFDGTSWGAVTQLSTGYPDWVHLGSAVPGLAIIAGSRGELHLSRPPLQ